jgi:crotonobetainyl-CoA:carnitine CoA-transferase CaiB-like acyl-CoA transferase
VSRLPLEDIRVVDCATVIAGPGCARYFADFGADVVKVEKPGGDSIRTLGFVDPRDGETLWWKLEGRNKRSVVLDLKTPEGHAAMLDLCDHAHVLVENFRPGALERLGLAPDTLLERNPRLVITRVTGFGQDGPYASKPGFATMAEAMSGFAALNGEPDGPPLLPPIALTDEVTALAAAFATMVALHSGVGQVVDVNLLESLLQVMGPMVAAHHFGYEQPRLGSGLPYSVPRGAYRSADGQWLAVSASADNIGRRLMALIGADEERFATNADRIANRDEVDRLLADWIAARNAADVIAAFDEAHCAVAPILDVDGVANDPHLAAREAFVDCDGVPLPGLVARLSKTPGAIRWAGRPLPTD